MTTALRNPDLWEAVHDDNPGLLYYQHTTQPDGTQRITLRDDLTYLGGNSTFRFAELPPEHRPSSDVTTEIVADGEVLYVLARSDGVTYVAPSIEPWANPGYVVPLAGTTWQINH